MKKRRKITDLTWSAFSVLPLIHIGILKYLIVNAVYPTLATPLRQFDCWVRNNFIVIPQPDSFSRTWNNALANSNLSTREKEFHKTTLQLKSITTTRCEMKTLVVIWRSWKVHVTVLCCIFPISEFNRSDDLNAFVKSEHLPKEVIFTNPQTDQNAGYMGNAVN